MLHGMLERMSEKEFPGLGGLANHLLGRNFMGLSNTTAFILEKILPGVLVKMRRERVPWAGKGRVPAKESRFRRAGLFGVERQRRGFLRPPLHSIENQGRETLITWSEMPRRALIIYERYVRFPPGGSRRSPATRPVDRAGVDAGHLDPGPEVGMGMGAGTLIPRSWRPDVSTGMSP
jgi:hypothetical protein